jgi:hypothetical protein
MADDKGFLGLSKKWYTLEHGWISIPVGLVVGLMLLIYQLLSMLMKKGSTHRRPIIRYFTNSVAVVCMVDFLLWAMTQHDPQIHNNYGLLMFMAAGLVYMVIALAGIVILLMTAIKALLTLTPFMEVLNNETNYKRWFELDPEVDEDGNVIPEPSVEPVVVKKPRKPRAKKVAPPVDSSKVSNDWLAERNAREANRKA